MDPESQFRAKRWPLSRKQTFLLLGGIIALILIVITIILMTKKDTAQESTGPGVAYYDRPGYDRQKLGNAFADPFAVKFTPNNTPVIYKGNKVIQACNLLSVEDITKQDLLLKANTLPTPVSRTFNDGIGKSDYNQRIYSSSLSGSSLGGEINNCHYVLEAVDGTPGIDINVFQPFSVPNDVVTEELQENYTATGTLEGLQVYTKKDSASISGRNATEYIAIQPGKGAFYLSLDLGADQASKKQPLLEAAAKNFVREQANPSGLDRLEYDSPIFPKSVVRACELITNEHVRMLSGRDAGPLAREGVATSIGSIRLNIGGDQVSYLNIDNECTRGTNGGGSGLGSDDAGDLNLTVETLTFLTDTPAKYSIDLQRQKNPNNRGSMPLPVEVGDESVGYTDISGGHHIVFSKGRVVVDIQLDQFAQRITKTTSLSSAIEKLMPIAESMADKIKL